MRSITDPPKQGGAFDDTPIHFVEEDKGQGFNNEPHTPPDPDDNYEDKLEAEGAFIINSTTYFSASNTRITKRSQTPEERAEQRMFEYYNR